MAQQVTSKLRQNGVSLYDKQNVKFLDDLHQLIMNKAIIRGTDGDTKVLDYTSPEQFKDKIDLEIQPEGVSNEALLELCDTVIDLSVQTGHPRFFNQFYSGREPAGLAGAWLTDALNTNLHTFEVAPVFVMVEKEIVKSLSELIGFPNEGDGIFVPGGSFANIMALHLARYNWNEGLKTSGLFDSRRLTIFTSIDSHYSMWKGAHFLGFGTDSVIPVKTDENGKMDPTDLEKMILASIAKGCTPFMVVATTGTTVLGAYDPLEPIADICKNYKLWLHADASWGGGVLFSSKHRHVFKGVERVDSIGWSLHKMCGAPLQCTALLTTHKGILQKCNGSEAQYLFQSDKYYDVSNDIGDSTVQCGRKVDSFKFWLMWKSLGTNGLEANIDYIFDNANYFLNKLESTVGFRLVTEKVTSTIKAQMVRDGNMMIGYTPMETKGYVNFFRIVFDNPATSKADLDFTVGELARIGHDL